MIERVQGLVEPLVELFAIYGELVGLIELGHALEGGVQRHIGFALIGHG